MRVFWITESVRRDGAIHDKNERAYTYNIIQYWTWKCSVWNQKAMQPSWVSSIRSTDWSGLWWDRGRMTPGVHISAKLQIATCIKVIQIFSEWTPWYSGPAPTYGKSLSNCICLTAYCMIRATHRWATGRTQQKIKHYWMRRLTHTCPHIWPKIKYSEWIDRTAVYEVNKSEWLVTMDHIY